MTMYLRSGGDKRKANINMNQRKNILFGSLKPWIKKLLIKLISIFDKRIEIVTEKAIAKIAAKQRLVTLCFVVMSAKIDRHIYKN